MHTTISGLAPYGDDYPVSDLTGSLRIERKRLPGQVDYGRPDLLVVSSTTSEGTRGDSATVRLPPPDGERRLSGAEVRRINAHREACQPDIDDRTSCQLRPPHPVAGPVAAVTAAELTRSVRRSLKADLSANFQILRLRCVKGSRCDAAFGDRGRRLEMSYRIQALKSARACWVLAAFSVTRPLPELGGFAAPLPHQGCVDR